MRPRVRSVVLAAALTVPAVAGFSGEGRAALTWDVTLGGGAMSNDNLHFDPETPVEEGRRQPVRETTFTASPGALVSWNSQRDRLRLVYSGEYMHFSGDEEQDPLWLHDLSADLVWRRWAPFFLELGERRNRVPRSQQRETEAVIDQMDHNRVSVRSGFGWDLGTRGIVELAYRGELESYPGEPDADRVLSQAGEGLWRYRWSPLWATEVRAAYGRVERDLSSDYTEASVSAAVEQRLSDLLTLEYGLEWVREEDDEAGLGDAGDASSAETSHAVRTNWLKSAALKGKLDRGGSWRLTYKESLAGLSDGDTLQTRLAAADMTRLARLGSSLLTRAWYESREYRGSGRKEEAWGPIVSARWMLAPWAACDLAVSWTSTTIREPEQDEVEDRTARVAAGIVVLLYDRATLEAGYGYRKNDSTDDLRSYTSGLVYGLLTFHFRPVGGGRLPASYASGLVTSPDDDPGQAGSGVAGTAAGTAR